MSMKPIFAKIIDSERHSAFVTKVIDRPFFATEFHFHHECQFTYVVKSNGRKMIGDSIEAFETDELTFLGSDVPHVWFNDKEEQNSVVQEVDTMQAQSLALYFDPDKLTQLLAEFISVKKIEETLQLAKRGMKFFGDTKEKMKKLLFESVEQNGMAKLLLLFEMLQLLCTTEEYKLLASSGYNNTYDSKDNKRIDTVFKYIFANFNSDISLEDLASIANMNKHAFCRFFKMRTQKTPVAFINEVRVAHAVKLMGNEDMSIGAIAYTCGYNSISNFNKFFKNVTSKIPSDYRKSVREF